MEVATLVVKVVVFLTAVGLLILGERFVLDLIKMLF